MGMKGHGGIRWSPPYLQISGTRKYKYTLYAVGCLVGERAKGGKEKESFRGSKSTE